ncbi:DUF1853 family protein [Litoribrevibacter albus]|uniref:DUF1853 family protein n=1 Tax=Litoribrevibacter albus TaxID=1473156 RepID=A0AA37SD13_9GAMM|nr:DUF1853 family protein [Litoribrevibacter albus]GLQ32314.1 hypothetical protein GCM10007876_27930 [Litoribrevibacter albus]
MKSALNIFNFSHQYVADLAWIIDSLPLLKNTSLTPDLLPPSFTRKQPTDKLRDNWLEQLNQLNQHPSSLIHYIEERPTTRVGFYYEALVSYLLHAFPDVTLLEEHLQLQDKGRTLGEIDFLYLDEISQKTIHLETAVKFYLGSSAWIDQSNSTKHWLGPMIKDRLDLKTRHLISHQSQMCFTDAFKNHSNELGTPTPSLRQVLLQGYLFLHPKDPAPLPYSKENNEFNKSPEPLWFKQDEMTKYLSENDRFLILKKPYWLGPFHNKEHNALLERNALEEQIKSLIQQWNRPILVSILNTEDTTNGSTTLYKESNRCFIVPNNWAGMSPPDSSSK